MLVAVSGVAGFFLGILAYSFTNFGLAGVGLLALISVLLFGTYFLKRLAFLIVASVFFLAAALGAGRVLLAPHALPDAFRPLVGKQETLTGVITSDPDLRETGQRITIQLTSGKEKTKLLAVAPLYPVHSIGEQVEVKGLVDTPAPFATDGGREFRYDQFLGKDGIFLIMERATVDTTAPSSGVWYAFWGALAWVKHTFAHALQAALPEPASALAEGLLIGGKQGLGPTLLDAFTRAGLLQIVVLSGYNVMIVAEAVLRVLRKAPQKISFILASLSIILFVLIAGAGSSAVRAGIMAVIALYARASGRTYDALRGLIIALIVMCLINPFYLAYDPGLALSALATVGLIIGTPLLELRLGWIKSVFARGIIATTICAQIAVLPLLLYQSGNLSLVSFFANVLAMLAVPFAMATSAAAGFIALIVPAIAPLVGIPAYVLLSYIMWIATSAAALPLAAFTLPAFPFVLVLAAYAALGYLVYRLRTTPPRQSGFRTRSS